MLDIKIQNVIFRIERLCLVWLFIFGFHFANTQNCLVSPPIEGENCDNCVAPGWAVYSLTPDISSPDVPIPVGCTFSNPPGPSPSGGSYQLLLGDSSTEGIKTTFNNLVDGEEYCFAVWWVGIDGDDCSLTAGDLQIVIQGNTTEFYDATEWELAEVTFTALSSSVTIIVKMKPGSNWIGLLVDDAVCEACCTLEIETSESLTYCVNESIQFDASYTGEGDSISFEWFCFPQEGLDYLNYTDSLNPIFMIDENEVFSFDTLFYTLKVWLDGCVRFSDLMIVIGDENVPVFDVDICAGDSDFNLPGTSDDDYTGSWTGNFDFANLGGTIQDYTFFIDDGQNNCIEEWTYQFPIEAADSVHFNLESFYCEFDSELYTLPNTSEEDIAGTWDISSFVPMNLGVGVFNFHFTPDLALACAFEYELIISIEPADNLNFNIPNNLCSTDDYYILPDTSLEGISGVWNLPVIDLSIPASSIFLVFYPDNFLSCYTPYTHEMSITPVDTPAFSTNTELCDEDDPFVLPNVSDNGYAGSWDINTVDPADINGILICTFTPNPNLYECVDSISLEFSVQTQIIPSFDLPEVFCSNSEVFTFSDTSLNGILGSWDIDTIDFENWIDTSVINSFTPEGSNCFVPLNIDIPILSFDSMEIEFMDPSACDLSDGLIQLSSTADVFEFSLDGGMTWSNSILLENLSAGIYPILYQGTLYQACSDSMIIELVTPDAPEIISLSVNAISDCEASDGTIYCSAFGIDLEYSIDQGQHWQSDSTFIDLTAGDYTIWVQPNGMPGCIDSSSSTVDTPMIPKIDSLNIFPITDCDSLNGFFEVFSKQNDLEFSIDDGISWQTAPIFSALGEGDYSLIIRTLNTLNCTLDTVFSIFAPALPTLNNIVSSDPSDCDSNDGNIMVVASGNELEFSIDNGVNWQIDPIFDNLASGQYTIQIREINAISCIIDTFATLANSASPELSYIIETPTTCDENSGIITVNADIPNVEFSIDGGLSWNTSGIFSGLSEGMYEIIAHIINQTACETSISVKIDAVLAQPQILNVELNNPSNCNGTDGFINLTVDIFDTEFSIDGGQSWSIIGIFFNLPAGDYTVIVQKTNKPDCAVEYSFTLDDPPCPCNELTINSAVESVNCTDPLSGSIEITDITGWIFPDNYQILWSNGEEDLTLENLESGWYSFEIQYDLNCSWTDSIYVDELMQIEFDWMIEDADCFGFGAIEMNNISGGTGNYEYSIDGSTFQSSPSFDNLEAGPYSLIVHDDKDCFTAQDIQLDLIDELVFEFGDIEPIYAGDTIFLVPSLLNMNIDSFHWSSSSDILNPGEIIAQVSPDTTTEYLLTLFAGPCTFSQSIWVEVLERQKSSLFIPNVFSPNNDGINDYFFIQGSESSDITLKELMIFDRWGNSVFQSEALIMNDASSGWNGTIHHSEVAMGVYTYILLYDQDGQSQSTSGSVTVLR